MKQSLDDLKAMDILFVDAKKAVEEMNNVVMINYEHLEEYKIIQNY